MTFGGLLLSILVAGAVPMMVMCMVGLVFRRGEGLGADLGRAVLIVAGVGIVAALVAGVLIIPLVYLGVLLGWPWLAAVVLGAWGSLAFASHLRKRGKSATAQINAYMAMCLMAWSALWVVHYRILWGAGGA